MNINNLSKRFWAYCFDIITVFGVYWIIFLLIKILSRFSVINAVLKEVYKVFAGISIGTLRGQAYYLVILYLSYGLLFFIYEVYFLSSKLSATPGKLTLGLEVVSYSGPSPFKIPVRSLLKVIATLIIPLTFLMFLISAISKTKQSPHDKLTKTYVIIKKTNKYKGTNPQMTLVEFFEEMKSRGMSMYSEQRVLAEEIYGSPKPLVPIIEPVSKGSFVGVFVLVASIIISLSTVTFFYQDIQNYILSFNYLYTQI